MTWCHECIHLRSYPTQSVPTYLLKDRGGDQEFESPEEEEKE
jgi:hypothetical protein